MFLLAELDFGMTPQAVSAEQMPFFALYQVLWAASAAASASFHLLGEMRPRKQRSLLHALSVLEQVQVK